MNVNAEQLGRNRILAALPAKERDLIAPLLEIQELYLGDVIVQAGEAIKRLYFPIDSAISIVNQQDNGRIVEVTVIGKEGCNGASVVQGSEKSPSVALVQVAGSAIAVTTSAVTRLSASMPYLSTALARYTLLLYRHSVISVGCSQFHSTPQRVARWLKAHWHRTGLETFPFTTAFFAAQVGINEKRVAEVLNELEGEQIVRLERISISISNQELLAQRSCECFQQAKDATDEYLLALSEIARTYA
jgi:CRP-like cAMP-binding protein